MTATPRRGCDHTACQEPPILLVGIAGEIDAFNADIVDVTELSEAMDPGTPLVMDMSEVEFLGLEGLRALFDLGDTYHQAGVPWVLVVNDAVQQMLRVGDPKCTLPTADSVAEAVQRLDTDTPAIVSPSWSPSFEASAVLR